MTDVRALLAAERQSRRITHPHLSYTKSGVLLCNICNLNVKSEALWEGHLKSANHRKNVAAQASRKASIDSTSGKGVKRKIEDVDEVLLERDELEPEARKKPKSRPESTFVEDEDGEQAGPVLPEEEAPGQQVEPAPAPMPVTDKAAQTNGTSTPTPAVNEDEWAAFEREVAPLAADKPKPDYSSATITAAPLTADQIKAQQDEDRRRRLETEAEDEKEDELGKLAEEFDVMEEMEDRVRKLRAKRDALRSAAKPGDDTGQATNGASVATLVVSAGTNGVEEDEEDEDEDDWYS
ncbi:hypothetical protein G647_00522 [Cladophialophora carrionii CBS 160.54]|uniref:Uncharacterized protein n=1 Tax=Cladophialophora carrionii CBS 160.54 TaxID=1279043 RepID=V9DP31_9EURO|nr:uncharacterized protein G647_00522 [Cladophialophora carrionii CBS 160.54]ETI28073.1 hypothetical protein G647_00522 [Cladophialophora carrionii CBS 160.54]